MIYRKQQNGLKLVSEPFEKGGVKMYVNPFWLGVGVTFLVECLAFIIFGIVTANKKNDEEV